MGPIRQSFFDRWWRLIAIFATGVAVVGTCGAQSPFMPPGSAAAAAPAVATGPLDTLEFRAVLAITDRTFVTLFDAATSKSLMIEIGQTVNNFRVTDYRLEGNDDVVVVESGGRTRTIKLRKATIVALAAPPMPVMPANNNVTGGPPMPQQVQPAAPGTITQMSDEEVRQRMQRVAEEIRRRRAVRRDMLEEQPQPVQQ